MLLSLTLCLFINPAIIFIPQLYMISLQVWYFCLPIAWFFGAPAALPFIWFMQRKSYREYWQWFFAGLAAGIIASIAMWSNPISILFYSLSASLIYCYFLRKDLSL